MVNWLCKSKLGEYWLLFQLWREDRQLKKAAKNFNLSANKVVITIKQEQLLEGIKKIKSRINSLVEGQTKEEYDRILKDINELGHLAIKNEDKEYITFINNAKKAFVYKDSDLQTELDKDDMIAKRISHYKELHKNKEWRCRAREERIQHNKILSLKGNKE